ncbi:DUF1223 domain-containing protein [Anaeromyxobacter paludicola]|uniref:DUF1223 domain-containing protein n=1 Tax=Anaeromyxobacter paludicola TaxID=2918171 RepID=UPI0020C12A50|nr:DUF1223 domain-containing protein [Anaeromyxobacter paludicola]
MSGTQTRPAPRAGRLAWKGLVAAVAASLAGTVGAADTTRVPVLVELFTSEGCSSCPPADAALSRLLRDQPIAGVRIIALSEHVDYWDGLGWRDPFSSRAFTRRQEAYARRLPSGGVYTPQLVIGGAVHLVGSKEEGARAAIETAAREPGGEVSARVVPGAGTELEVAARWPAGIQAQVLVALVQDRAVSLVERGENAGRRLEHVAIARAVSAVGSGSGSFSGRVKLPGAQGADRAVIFVQEGDGGRIHGVASVELGDRKQGRRHGSGGSRRGNLLADAARGRRGGPHGGLRRG